MELKTLRPWVILIGAYFVLLYVLGPLNYNFAGMAPGVVIIGALCLSISQVRKYMKERKAYAKTAI